MTHFTVLHRDGKARIGRLRTAHGIIETPFFMPAATKATGKVITTDDYQNLTGDQNKNPNHPKGRGIFNVSNTPSDNGELMQNNPATASSGVSETNKEKSSDKNDKTIKVKALISNSLILSLEPGTEVIQAAGGLHKFMNFQGVIFTDCGGFQMSRNMFEKKSKKGIHFRNPFNLQKVVLTPQKSAEIQLSLGHDVAMMLDDMSKYGVSEEEAREAMENTHRWGQECLETHQHLRQKIDSKQMIFGIVQGNFYPHLREESAKFINSLDFDGIAIGGVAIGEPKDKLYQAVDAALPFITEEKPRYVMGVGSPEEILELIGRGIDCFDSVYPTQNARHGTILTKYGRLYLDGAKFAKDFSPLEKDCHCHTCQTYTKSYLHHLSRIDEPAGKRLRSIHNLYFILNMVEEAKKAIKENRFEKFKEEFIHRYKTKGD